MADKAKLFISKLLKQNQEPMTLKELEQILQIPSQEIEQIVKQLQDEKQICLLKFLKNQAYMIKYTVLLQESKNLSKEEDEQQKQILGEQEDKNKELNEQLNLLQEQLLKQQNEKLIVDRKIKSMHKYNEIKDIAQAIYGKIAEMEGKTIQEVYNDFDINFDCE